MTGPRPPEPREVRVHRSLGTITGSPFADDADVVNGQTYSVKVPIAGEARWRCRMKLKNNAAGTLRARYLRPDQATQYGSDNPADTPLAANGEGSIGDNDVRGESVVEIIFVCTATGKISFADFCHF